MRTTLWLSVLALLAGRSAAAVTIDFEDLPLTEDTSLIISTYAPRGVLFTSIPQTAFPNADVPRLEIYDLIYCSGYPSGNCPGAWIQSQVLVPNRGAGSVIGRALRLDFSPAVLEVSGRVVAEVDPATVIALGEAGQQVGQTLLTDHLNGSDFWAFTGPPIAIATVTITAGPSGGGFALDDLSFQPVPEPSAFALAAAAVGAMFYGRNLSQRR